MWAQVSRKRLTANAEPATPMTIPTMTTKSDYHGQLTGRHVEVGLVVRVAGVGVKPRVEPEDGAERQDALRRSPWTRPSHMNGIRMNQFVAPTSFMTATSRLLAKIARRIVFKMRTVADSSRTKASTKRTHCET